MREAGLRGVSRRRWVNTTRRALDARPAPDLVQRHFQLKCRAASFMLLSHMPDGFGQGRYFRFAPVRALLPVMDHCTHYTLYGPVMGERDK